MQNKLELKDVVEIFLSYSIHEIKKEKEIPNLNFIFKKDGYELFKKIVDESNNSLHHAEQADIDFLSKHSADDCLSIQVNDSLNFFEKLTNIINETIELFKSYGDSVNPREAAIYLLRRIWLRIGINDIENIDNFLKNQLQFVKNRTFDHEELSRVGAFQDCDLFMKTKANELWDETTRSMIFTLKNVKGEYELPHILYDINDEGICYIYGVQSSQTEKSKSIERKLYSLNKNIENPNVHPSKVCALLFFIEQLKSKKISKVVVPSMQVLSYHYHELLSLESKKNYDEIKKQANETDDIYVKNRYEYLKNWYEHVYQKQDKISYLKIEELINLIYRITEHTDVEITNEVGIQGDSLNFKIK